MVALGEGNRTEAEDWFRKALALAPGHVPGRYELGRSLVARGKLEEGLREIDSVIRLDPRHTAAYYQRGAALARLGCKEESESAFRRFQELERADREARSVMEKKVLVPSPERP